MYILNEQTLGDVDYIFEEKNPNNKFNSVRGDSTLNPDIEFNE